MRELYIWLMLYTKISNDRQTKTSNKEIKETFLKDYPQYKPQRAYLGVKIGAYLRDIYPNLILSGGGSLQDVITYSYSQHLDKILKTVNFMTSYRLGAYYKLGGFNNGFL